MLAILKPSSRLAVARVTIIVPSCHSIWEEILGNFKGNLRENNSYEIRMKGRATIYVTLV